jgi:hypothetical protein
VSKAPSEPVPASEEVKENCAGESGSSASETVFRGAFDVAVVVLYC